MRPAVPRAWRRGAFWLYAIALFTATHWPNLRIEGPIKRPDLIIHLAAFGLWTALLIAFAAFGPALSARNILACVGIAALYAAFDESTQAIPFLNRTAAWDDYAANLGGVAAACLIAMVVKLRADALAPISNRCPACGYSLAGLRGRRCPECGASAGGPTDPETHARG